MNSKYRICWPEGSQDEQNSISPGFSLFSERTVVFPGEEQEGKIVYFLGVLLSSGWFGGIMWVKVMLWKETWPGFPLPHLGFSPTISNHLISYLFFLCPSFFLCPPHWYSSIKTHLLASFLLFREVLDINSVAFLDCVALCPFGTFPVSQPKPSPFSLTLS